MLGIRMLDGSVVSGSTWDEVETNWSNSFMNQLVPKNQFRSDVQQRAKVWSAVDIAIDGSAKDFLQECERAGLCITFDTPHGVPTLPETKLVSVPRIVYLNARREAAERRNAKG